MTTPHHDQADGLRARFCPHTGKAYCLASTLDADCTALLGFGTAHALANNGHRTLIIDEVPLTARRRLNGFAYPMRYDLGQVFSGFVSLTQAIRPVNERLWYAIGTRVRTAFDNHETTPPNLVNRLLAAQIEIDFTLIASCDPHNSALALYAPNVRRIVVAAPGRTAAARALELLRELSVIKPNQPVPVLVVGHDQESQGQATFAQLEESARSLLNMEIQPAGWIPSRALGSMDPGLMLPISLYRALAGAVSTMEFA